MPPVRYVVQCPHCGARTGTNPPGMDMPDPDYPDRPAPTSVPCVQCGFSVTRRGGEFLRSPNQNADEMETDLLGLE